MSVARFQTYAGSCEITEDEVRITKSRVTSLKRKTERKRKTSLFIVCGSALIFFLFWYVNDSIAKGFLGLGLFVLAPAIIIYAAVEIFKFVRWEVAKRRHDTPEGGFVFAGTIPRSQIVSVGASPSGNGSRKGSAIAVNFEQEGVRTSGVMRFVDDERLERAKTAFRTADISVEEV